MGAIDNTNLTGYRSDLGTTGFSPVVTYAYDSGAEEVDFTNSSTFPSGVAVKKVIVNVHDKFGNSARGFILPVSGGDSGHDGDTTVDVSGLDASQGLDVTATVIADDDKLIADGSAYNIGAAGSLSNWDKQKNA